MSDATATFDRTGPDGRTFPAALVHAVALGDLHGEFATVVTTDALLGALLGAPAAASAPECAAPATPLAGIGTP